MADKEKYPRKQGWMRRYSIPREKDSSSTLLEGQVSEFPTTVPSSSSSTPYSPSSPSSVRLPELSPTVSIDPADRPHVPVRRSSSSSLTNDQLDLRASQIILNALERSNSATPQSTPEPQPTSSRGSFGKMAFSSMMGSLSTLSLSRSSEDKERGRSWHKEKEKPRCSSVSARDSQDSESLPADRTRSMSPFLRRNSRARDPSPSVEALKLSQSDAESDSEGVTTRSSIRPRNAFSQSPHSDDESADDGDSNDSEESWSENGEVDTLTVQNTEHNALIPAETLEPDGIEAPDPLGEGVNIIMPPEPYFPSTMIAGNPRRKKSMKHESLPIQTSPPIFKRDRCTITLTQGDPRHALETNNRRSRRYVVASDLSEESRYAMEWAVGTVLRDGDELIIVSVTENESKVDPPNLNNIDRVTKIRSQQDRQTLAYILLRQVTSLLQRTRLHVTVACQAWHAKNSRHMLLDIVDHAEPTMLIVGSRGLGQLQGILLGSTSHYLVQKCSVPVMVARRRLKRPAKRSAHLSTHRARVSLAEAAGVESITPKVDKEVEQMRDQLTREDERREHQVEEDIDTEFEGDNVIGQKVRGE